MTMDQIIIPSDTAHKTTAVVLIHVKKCNTNNSGIAA